MVSKEQLIIQNKITFGGKIIVDVHGV